MSLTIKPRHWLRTIGAITIALSFAGFSAPRAVAIQTPSAHVTTQCVGIEEVTYLSIEPVLDNSSSTEAVELVVELYRFGALAISETYPVKAGEKKLGQSYSFPNDGEYDVDGLRMVIHANDRGNPLFDKTYFPAECPDMPDSTPNITVPAVTYTSGNYQADVKIIVLNANDMFVYDTDTSERVVSFPGIQVDYVEHEFTVSLSPGNYRVAVAGLLQQGLSKGFKVVASSPEQEEITAPKVEVLGVAKVITSPVARTLRITNLDNSVDDIGTYRWFVEDAVKGVIVDEGLTGQIPRGTSKDIKVMLPAGEYSAHAINTVDDAISNVVRFVVDKYPAPTYSVPSKAKGLVKVCVAYPTYRLMWEDGNSTGTKFYSNHWTGTKYPGCTTLNTPNVPVGTTNWVRVTVSVPGPNVVKKIRIRR